MLSSWQVSTQFTLDNPTRQVLLLSLYSGEEIPESSNGMSPRSYTDVSVTLSKDRR